MGDREQYLLNIRAKIKADQNEFNKLTASLNGEIFLEEIRLDDPIKNVYLRDLLITREKAQQCIKAIRNREIGFQVYLKRFRKSFEQTIVDELLRVKKT